jgi:uncharacterized damage-inducible protein DinB
MRMHTASLVILTLVAAPVLAQTPSGGAANPIAQAVREGWDTAKRNMLGSAKVMPEAKYGFKPVDTVRSFGQILAHVAGANFEFCSAALGEKTPHAEAEFEKSATTPAAIVKALQDSIAYCDKAYAALTDRTAAEIISGPFGGGKQARAAALIGNTGHNNEHYGNLVTYLRINGLVPPSSAPSR